MKSNVLFLHSSSELYGSDRSLLNIVKSIDKNKFVVHVILPCEGPLVDEMRKIPDIRITIYEIAVLRRKNLSLVGMKRYAHDYRKSIKYLREYIKTNKIDVVDVNTAVVFPGPVAAQKEKIKCVWHIREIISNPLENHVISWMMEHYADYIVANSKETGKALLVNQEKVRVIYNAVEQQKDVEKNPHDNIIVGMAGRINRWKGQKLFVDAAEIVHRKKPNIMFCIAGDVYLGEEYIKEDLVQYINEKELSETVILLGQVNDMKNFYKSIDIFVLPSVQPEPFGLVIIEAMQYSLPVIATNHGGPTEIIVDGENGYLVGYRSADEMASRIIELVEDPSLLNNIGNQGNASIVDRFSVKIMVESLERLFEEASNI